MTNLVIMAIVVTTNFFAEYDPIATRAANDKAGETNGYISFYCTSQAVCCVATDYDIGYVPKVEKKIGQNWAVMANGEPVYLYTWRMLDRDCRGGGLTEHRNNFMYRRERKAR